MHFLPSREKSPTKRVDSFVRPHLNKICPLSLHFNIEANIFLRLAVVHFLLLFHVTVSTNQPTFAHAHFQASPHPFPPIQEAQC